MPRTQPESIKVIIATTIIITINVIIYYCLLLLLFLSLSPVLLSLLLLLLCQLSLMLPCRRNEKEYKADRAESKVFLNWGWVESDSAGEKECQQVRKESKRRRVSLWIDAYQPTKPVLLGEHVAQQKQKRICWTPGFSNDVFLLHDSTGKCPQPCTVCIVTSYISVDEEQALELC